MKSARNYASPYTSISLKEYIQNPSVKLAVCWKLVARKGRTVAATSYTRDLTLSAHPNIIFRTTQGVVSSAVDNELGLSSAGMEVDAMFIVDVLDEESVVRGDWDGAYFEVFMLNPDAPAMGEFVMYAGYIGELRTYGQRFKAEGRPLSSKSAQEIGSLFTPRCTVLKLGDARCKVNLDSVAFDGMPITVTGTVTSSGSNIEFTDSSRTEVNKLFNFGVVEFTSGILNGIQAEVKTYAGLPEGERVKIVSDNGWKCSHTFSGDAWKQQGFNDSAWQATYQQGYATSMPWGSVSAIKNFPIGSTAQWIWSKDTVNAYNAASIHPPCAFRKTFVSGASTAKLIIAGDNKFKAYLNGTLIAEGTDWRMAQVVPLSGLSTNPAVPNVLAVEVENDNFSTETILAAVIAKKQLSNPAGVLADLTLGRVTSSGSGGTFLLQNPLTRTIPVGTTYKAVRGCDREWETCRDSFGNLYNFRGFPFVPGLEKVYRVNPEING